MENIVGHYTAYSVEKKCLLCTFWGEEGAVNEYLECSWISMSLMVGMFLSWFLFPSSWSVECTAWRSSRGGSTLSLRSRQLINLLVQRGYEMLSFTWRSRSFSLGWDSTTEVTVSPKTSLLRFCGETFYPNQVMCGCSSSQCRSQQGLAFEAADTCELSSRILWEFHGNGRRQSASDACACLTPIRFMFQREYSYWPPKVL